MEQMNMEIVKGKIFQELGGKISLLIVVLIFFANFTAFILALANINMFNLFRKLLHFP